MKKNIVLFSLILGIALAIEIIIGISADKILVPKYSGTINTNVEINDKLKVELVQTAYDYLDKKGLIKEWNIDKKDEVSIKKEDNYDPSFMGSLTST